ncbi:amino acid adenylation domain-containing protein [Nonomuraea sp. NPDC050556]|uniref:amino acid adenylation domain-containing protein n=1 Tax=Nonomuraea sp. NPDC050556 TaxID=3364369 RepID=UPI0037B940F6
MTVMASTYEFPASFRQERLWLLDRVGGGQVYLVPLAFACEGELDVPALASAFAALVDRHESLRTALRPRDGACRQVVHDDVTLRFDVVDLTALEGAEGVADALMAAEGRRGFDLAEAPLLRVVVVRLAGARSLLLVTLHHAVCDAWSVGVMLRDLAALHGGAVLPDPAVQYADFTVWQDEQFHGGGFDQQLAYWRDRLAGSPPTLELPTDRARPRLPSHQGAALPFALPPEMAERVRRVARARGATPFMVLLTAYALVLGRYAGTEDVVIGCPVAGRTDPDLDDLVGFLVNTLVLRVDLGGSPSVADLLKRVRTTVLDAYAHQDVPFERVMEDQGRPPRLSVLFAFQLLSAGGFTLGGVRLRPVSTHTGGARADLTLSLHDGAGELAGIIEYATDLFDRESVAGLASSVRHALVGLLDALEHDQTRPAGDLDLAGDLGAHLTAWETGAAPAAWGGLAVPDALDHMPNTRIIFPDARADGAVALGDLLAWADGLAARLVELGAGAESIVGISCDRSPAMLAAALGCWRAGAAFVPLDPAFPADRLAYMAQDAGVRIIISDGDHIPFPCDHVVVADRVSPGPAVPREPLAAEALAYVLYTSGSTGRPKGVQISHGALTNFLESMAVRPGLRATDTLVAVTTLAFDIAQLELWLPLLTGARLVVAGRETATDGAALAGLLTTSGATVMQATPATWRMLLDAAWSPPPGFRVLCGGEAFPPDLADALLRAGAEVWNLYGPTETTVWSTTTRVDDPAAITLGAPVARTAIRILDAHLRASPPGVPGELGIGGAGVARGYRDRPALTADRFVPDPYGPPGARLYRTGDVARITHDGRLEYLGRADNQVKLRGYRIELGEIEHHLAAVPGVAQAVVTVTGEGAADARLVAHLVPAAGHDPHDLTLAVVKGALRDALPPYMHPSGVLVHHALPLTPNGKLDRKALAAISVRVGQVREVTGPRTPMEEVVAAAFADCLNAGAVDVEDDFFALGGTSLTASRLVDRLRTALGTDLSLRAFFEQPTVAGVAVLLQRGLGHAAATIPRAVHGDGAVLSPGQERLFVLERFGDASYHLSMRLELTGALDVPALARALGEVVDRHEILRTAITMDGPEPRQHVRADVTLPFAVIEANGPVGPVLTGAPFDLAEPPLIRAALVRHGPARHELLLTVHHIAFDGWSAGVFARDLLARYQGEHLAPLPLAYADFAAWQRGADPADQVAYWKERLAGAEPLRLPTDRPRPAVGSGVGGYVPIRLDRALTARLRKAAADHAATPYMLLLAAFALLAGRRAGQDTVVVGTPVAGRPVPELADLVGFFVNTLPMRVDLADGATVGELLGGVRRSSLAAFAHQDVPYERLVHELGLRRAPLVQVMLALQDRPVPELRAGDLVVTPLPAHSGGAKFDLSVWLQDGSDEIEGIVEYAADLFDAATVERLAADLVELVEAITGDPTRPLATFAADPHQPLPEAGEAAEAGPGTAEWALTRRVGRVIAEVLGLRDVTPEDDFFELGGTSLAAVRLQSAIRAAEGVDVPLKRLIAWPTVAGIASAVGGAVQTGGDPREDGVLEPGITAAGLPGPRRSRPARVMLTGATGFVGAFLLRELAKEATVHCPVRAATPQEGLARIEAGMRELLLWDDDLRHRIVAVPADLAKPRLGLAQDDYDELSAVDTIYHNGAHVSFALPYSTLRAANVGGTREVLRLATTGHVKPVHYVSTLDLKTEGRITETPPSLTTGDTFGYTLSKKVGELLVLAAGERGVPVSVYRPGLIGGDTRTGAGNRQDYLALALEQSLRTGTLPDPAQLRVHATPVDWVCATIAANTATGIFHLYDPGPTDLTALPGALAAHGHDLTVVDLADWLGGAEGALSAYTGLVTEPDVALRAELTPPPAPAAYVRQCIAYLLSRKDHDHGH